MKCPKCQYLGFEGQTRCRHCGYDLTLASTIEVDAPEAPAEAGGASAAADVVYRAEPSARAQARAAIQKRAASRTPQPEAFDLPLFATPGVDDRPALPASRPPLSVRRTANEPPRARTAAAWARAPIPEPSLPIGMAPPADAPGIATPAADTAVDAIDAALIPIGDAATEPRLELELAPVAEPEAAPAAPEIPIAAHAPAAERPGVRGAGGTVGEPSASAGYARALDDVVAEAASARRRPTGVAGAAADAASADGAAAEADAVDVAGDGRAAPLGLRMVAGLIDVALLAAVDAAVVAATLRATGLDWREIDRLPLAPLGVFLVLLAVGYLSMCAVLAGKTFGKAVAGLAIVETGGRPVRLAPAVVRAAIQVLTVPAFGIGFLPALLGADRRALYDRLAGTDVVRDAGAGPTE
jgi:uncharacterized RDD family membrane protein YckC